MEFNLHSHQFTEDNVKKNNFSPLTVSLLSLSLCLGILVSELNGLRVLTTVHAQGAPCGGVVTGSTVRINDGVIGGGVYIRDVTVNGELVAQAIIAGNLHIVQGDVTDANGALVGGGAPSPSGALVGGGAPSPSGALVGGGAPVQDGDTAPSPCVDGILLDPSGALVGGGAPVQGGDAKAVTVRGASISVTGSFVGGTLTGDNVVIRNGVITGQNLLLSGSAIDGGSIEGTVTTVQISPAN